MSPNTQQSSFCQYSNSIETCHLRPYWDTKNSTSKCQQHLKYFKGMINDWLSSHGSDSRTQFQDGNRAVVDVSTPLNNIS